MAQHVIAFCDAVAAPALAAKLPAADDSITIAGLNILVPANATKLLAVYACGVGLVQVQLQAPSIRRVALLDIGQFDGLIAPLDHLFYKPFFNNPITLQPSEGLQAWVLGPAAVPQAVVCILGDAAPTPVSGEIFSVAFATGGPVAIVGAWVNSPIALGQVLPVGRYALVGARVETPAVPNLVAFRFVNPGGGPRPGGIGINVPWEAGLDEQRFGKTGVWLEFDSANIPSLDILAQTAVAHATVGFMDLIKIG
jgi:hypothetical protein